MLMCQVCFVCIPLKKIKRSSGMGWSEKNRRSSLPRGGSWGALGVWFGWLPAGFVWRCSSHDQLGGDPNTLEALPLLSPTPQCFSQGSRSRRGFQQSPAGVGGTLERKEGTFSWLACEAPQYLGEFFKCLFTKTICRFVFLTQAQWLLH